ncbi:MAG: autotransporter outer membrane beta-barrel domain-containing protein [Akkermansia sp.]|nr:autotransporter outer membrane beta-barrel domain-containing protein [Akkermansia sp.]
MKKTKFLLALLAICPMVGYTYADVVDYNYSDYSSFQHTVSEGKVTIVAGTGNGEDYSKFDMYEGDSPSTSSQEHKDVDKGFILGGSANGLVSQKASGNPTVESVSITTNDIIGASIAGIGFASSSVTGAIDIEVNGGKYTNVTGGVAYKLVSELPVDSESVYYAPEKSTGNNISITLNNGADVYLLYGGHSYSGPIATYFGSQKHKDDAYPSENYDKLMADNPWAVGGNVDIVVNDARIGGLYASGNNMHSVDGNVSVKIYSGEVYGEFVAGPMSCHSHIGGDMKLLVTGDAEIKCAIYGGHWVKEYYMEQGSAPTIKGDTSFEFSGQSVMHNDVFLLGPGVHLEGDGRVSLQDNAEIKGTLYAKNSQSVVSDDTELSLTVGGANNKPYIGSVGGILRFDKMVVSEDSRVTLTGSNVFDTPRQTYTINEGNRTTAVMTLTDKASVSVDKPLSLAVNFKGNGAPGRYKIIDASAVKSAVDLSGWNADMVTMVGGNIPFEAMFWEDEVLYIMFDGQPVMPIDLDFADAVKASGWGSFSGGQAFGRAITANHFNSVQLNANAFVGAYNYNRNYSADAIRSGKEGITYGATGRTIAWFSGYGQLGRISGNGADYGLYGAAMGLERQFGQHRSIGLAFGYDWGKISPFSCSSIDQDSMRFAVYGQYGTWKAGSGNIVLDWSVAYGDTTSSHDYVEGDWSQDSWQFDLRGTYFRRVSNRSVGYGFMSVQYYEQSGATVGNMEFSSMKNLRLKAGGGMSYAVSPRTSVYGEAALFYDAVREDSCMYADGECYEGTNPGRAGVNVGVGASYIINDRWTARGNYSFDAAKDHIEHNMDFGVIYSF